MEQPFEPYALNGAVWGFQAETGLHAARLIMGGVFDDLPHLQIVLGHMGEGLPYWIFRMDQMYGMMSSLPTPPAGFKRLKRRPSEYIRENFHITTSGMFSDEVLEFGIRSVGADRVLFAIDYPFESCTEAAEWLRAAPIRADELAMIAHRNAERLFRIS